MNSAIPKYRFKSVLDITVDDLKKMGAEAVALDIDNTICYDGTSQFLDGFAEWLNAIKGAGYPVIIISNAGRKRVQKVAEAVSLPFMSSARKPFSFKLKRAAREMGISVTKLAMVGDQLLADAKAANRCGAIAVRVDPIADEIRYQFHFKRRRKKEAPFIAEFENMHGYGVYDE